MTDYWHYKAVHYWANIVRNKQAFCKNAEFFGMVGTILPPEEGIARIWEAISKETLHWLQTREDPCERKLDLHGDYSLIWFNLWNHSPIRETIRTLLLSAAQNWLAVAEQAGVAPYQGPVLTSRQEVEFCVGQGLLHPPDSAVLPEDAGEFFRLACG